MGLGNRERERNEHVRDVCVCVCVCVCVSNKRAHVSLLYDHTPTGACECPLADRHTHVELGAGRLMRMLFY